MEVGKTYERGDRMTDEMRAREKAICEVAKVKDIGEVSDGFIRGYDAAIAMIVESLTTAYRDIPMTEDELYVLVELGDARRMARVRDAKSRQIAEKAGWEKEWHGMIPTWKKVEPKEEQAEATE